MSKIFDSLDFTIPVPSSSSVRTLSLLKDARMSFRKSSDPKPYTEKPRRKNIMKISKKPKATGDRNCHRPRGEASLN